MGAGCCVSGVWDEMRLIWDGMTASVDKCLSVDVVLRLQVRLRLGSGLGLDFGSVLCYNVFFPCIFPRNPPSLAFISAYCTRALRYHHPARLPLHHALLFPLFFSLCFLSGRVMVYSLTGWALLLSIYDGVVMFGFADVLGCSGIFCSGYHTSLSLSFSVSFYPLALELALAFTFEYNTPISFTSYLYRFVNISIIYACH